MDVVQLRARVGMVFQKPNPFPKSIYENVAYGPRIHGLADGTAGAGVDRRALAEARRPVGRSEGPPGRERHRSVRRPAAAPLHRPRHRRRSRGDPDGRALLGARSDRHRQDRGADPRASRPLRDRHRHPQYAAGRARVAADRLLPSRRAASNMARRRRSSPIRRSSGPRITSPAATAEETGTWQTPVTRSKPSTTISTSFAPASPRWAASPRRRSREAMRALAERDSDAARMVVDEDKRLDALEAEIERSRSRSSPCARRWRTICAKWSRR